MEIQNKKLASSWRELLTGANGWRSIALSGGVLLHATDVFLATTIMPSVTSEIGGLSFYAWATTIYVMTAIIGAIFSTNHLSKNGPKRAYLSAILVFICGSILCAVAPLMPVFLLGRAIQGFGGGLLFSLSYAMIRIVFEEKLWSRAMALVSAMWGISAFSGPFIGGVFAEHSHWRMAFVTLIGIGIALSVVVQTVLPKRGNESLVIKKMPLVQMGLITLGTLSISIGSALETAWSNGVGVLLALILFVGLVRVEKNSINRLLPTGAYSLKTVLGQTYALMILLTIGTAVEIYIPYFLQYIHGFNPLKAGYITVVIALGWSLSSILFSGKTAHTVRVLIKVGPVLLLFGLLGLAFLLPYAAVNNDVHMALMLLCLALMGAGVGMGWPHLLTRVLQTSVSQEADLASASITIIQLLATAIGTALVGLTVNLFGITGGQLSDAVGAAEGLLWIFIAVPIAALCMLYFVKHESR